MIDNADLIIKNDRLGAIIGRAMAKDTPAWDKMTTQESGEDIIVTYALDMVMNGYKVDAALDFTYATLNLLPVAMRRCLAGYIENGNSFRESVEGLAKSFAAYIFCLAMNENDCPWTVQVMRSKVITPAPGTGPLWANGYRITTGLRRQADFLIPAMEGGSGMERDGKGLAMLSADPMIKAYKSAFRVDLSEYGLKNMVFEVDLK